MKLENINTGPCELFVKLESKNPTGSIKDRIALAMVLDAEERGALRPGGTIVEATAGNTGLALAMVATLRGYRCTLVVPDKFSAEKVQLMKGFGATVVRTRDDVEKDHPDYYVNVAARIAREEPGAWHAHQFVNPANPRAHEKSTGPEILSQMRGDVDAVVCGVGSGGTLTGLGRYFSAHSPKTKMILADPVGSLLADYVEFGEPRSQPQGYLVEGIGQDHIPKAAELSFVSHAYRVSDQESFEVAGQLIGKEGILAGSSSGTLVAAALRYCRAQTSPLRVVTFICDTGSRYISKLFNPWWRKDHGIDHAQRFEDLRDVIGRPSNSGGIVATKPDETLQHAFIRMRANDVSQLPVMEGSMLVGIIDEYDLLGAVAARGLTFATPIRQVMTNAVRTVQRTSPLNEVYPLLDDGLAVPVMDGDRFLGLITRADVLQYLRTHAALELR